MSSCFSLCCGEGEEESRYGGFVDSSNFDAWDDFGKNGPRPSGGDESVGARGKVEQFIGLMGIGRRKSAQTRGDAADAAGEATTMLRAKIHSKPLDLSQDFQAPVHPKTNAQIAFLEKAMEDNFLFTDLSEEERRTFFMAMEKVGFTKGNVVIRQGDVGDYFYIVERGHIDFVDGDKVVGQCSDGSSFGELALLYDCPRAVSCVVSSDTVSLWKIDQETFRQILARSCEDTHSNTKNWLRSIDIFKEMEDSYLAKFAEAMITVHWKAGDRIVQKGEAGNVFYIVQEGKVKVHDIGLGDSTSCAHEIGPGSFFGEGSLLTGEPRAASVTALTDVTTLALDRGTFESCLGPLKNLLDFAHRKKFLNVLPLFRCGSLTEPEIDQLVGLMKEVCYCKGTKLVAAGEKYPMQLWIIQRGHILVYSSKNPNKIFNLAAGDYFGDKSIRGDLHHISSHTAICEENLTSWVLTREDIESVIGDIDRLGQPVDYTKAKRDKKICLCDLTKQRILGSGAFGRVWLVTHKTEKTPYALKSISKRLVLDSHLVDSVMREKELMTSIEHQFILSLIASYQDEKYIYLLLPVIPGGELYEQLHKRKTRTCGFPKRDAAFYAACVIEGLGHFHQRSIAYRDLKLENVMIDEDGYLVIVDLGFAKIVTDKTYTLVGTPEYLAPEIILSKGHDKAVDYWSYGVLVYELLVGVSPFYRQNTSQMSMFKRIVTVNYSSPECVDETAQSFIEALLCRRPLNRLGNLANGYLDVKAHDWFKIERIKFKQVIKKEVPAPWKPEPKDLTKSASKDRRDDSTYGKRLTKEEQDLFRDY